jgi:hypothetical protein
MQQTQVFKTPLFSQTPLENTLHTATNAGTHPTKIYLDLDHVRMTYHPAI